MPELPEVECLTRAVRSVLLGRRLIKSTFHRSDLRWPIPIEEFEQRIVGLEILGVERRSKYLILTTQNGHAILHLGMSGNILLSDSEQPSWNHTHASWTIDIQDEVQCLHFVDPRRFGCILCCGPDELQGHRLLKNLGPEPLDRSDLAEHLWQKSRKKSVAIKNFLMDAHIVVGVGNIYANEALFRAGIRPTRSAMTIKTREWSLLAEAIREVLSSAIRAGGTSFRDYRHVDGSSGYFEVALKVYGREHQNCSICGQSILLKKLAGRATYYCRTCQK